MNLTCRNDLRAPDDTWFARFEALPVTLLRQGPLDINTP